MNNVVEFPQQEESEPKTAEQPAASTHAYAELAVTTNFSFLRGASHPKEFILQAAALGLTGIGIADRNSVAGVVRAYYELEQWNEHARSTGQPTLKLVVGARLVFADGTPDILAYPQNRKAWGRLTRLLTVGKSRGEKAECILFLEDLLEHIAGLNLIVMPPVRLSKQRAQHDALSTPLPPRSGGEGSPAVAKAMAGLRACPPKRSEGGSEVGKAKPERRAAAEKKQFRRPSRGEGRRDSFDDRDKARAAAPRTPSRKPGRNRPKGR